jgi:tRNA A-37 threonylcarbamoyl transferase component Bud32
VESLRSDSSEYHKPNPEKEKDIARQQEFSFFVESIRKPNVFALPDLDFEMHTDGTVSDSIEDFFNGRGNRMYIDDRLLDVNRKTDFPDRLVFRPQPLLRIGKEDSRHQPFFGKINGKWFHDAANESHQIAVKPIVSPKKSPMTKQKLLHEVAVYQHLRRIGVPTLDVLGVAVLDQPRNEVYGYAITDYDPDIVTLDSLDWKRMSKFEHFEHIENATDYISLLHSNLIFHGDCEFKNIAIGESKKSIKVVDVEWSTILTDRDVPLLKIKQNMSVDLAMVGKSIDNFVFKYWKDELDLSDDSKRFNVLHTILYEPYYEKLVHSQIANT